MSDLRKGDLGIALNHNICDILIRINLYLSIMTDLQYIPHTPKIKIIYFLLYSHHIFTIPTLIPAHFLCASLVANFESSIYQANHLGENYFSQVYESVFCDFLPWNVAKAFCLPTAASQNQSLISVKSFAIFGMFVRIWIYESNRDGFCVSEFRTFRRRVHDGWNVMPILKLMPPDGEWWHCASNNFLVLLYWSSFDRRCESQFRVHWS